MTENDFQSVLLMIEQDKPSDVEVAFYLARKQLDMTAYQCVMIRKALGFYDKERV